MNEANPGNRAYRYLGEGILMATTQSGRRPAFLLGEEARPVTVEKTQLDGSTWYLTAESNGLSPVHSYLLTGNDGCLLFNPGSHITWPEILGGLIEINESLDISWVAGSSPAPDALGALPLLESTLGSEITLVTSPAMGPAIRHYGVGLPLLTLDIGGSVDIGGRRLTAELGDRGQPDFRLCDSLSGRTFGTYPHRAASNSTLPDRFESARRSVAHVLLTTLAPIALEGRALAALAPVGRVTSLRAYVRQDESWWELGGRAGLLGTAIITPPDHDKKTLRVELADPVPTVLDLRFAPQSAGVLAEPALADLVESLRQPLTSALRRLLTLREQLLTTRQLRSNLRRDPLTGAGNRRAMQSWNHSEPWSLLLIDLDTFREINDLAGRNAGDRVLRTVSDLVSRELDDDGLLVRYGGDKFIAMLTQDHLPAALDIAHRIRRIIAAADMIALGVPRRVTASIGVACGSGTANALVSAADKVLHAAKSTGTNQVTSTTQF